MDWKNAAKSIGIGLGFAFLMYVLTEYSGSLAIGLLLAYVDYQIRILKEGKK